MPIELPSLCVLIELKTFSQLDEYKFYFVFKAAYDRASIRFSACIYQFPRINLCSFFLCSLSVIQVLPCVINFYVL